MPLKRLSPRRSRQKSLRSPLNPRLRREEGASLVEFAISLGIFLAITVGLLILCTALFTYEYVDFAAREAARWAAVRGSDCHLSTSTMPGCTTVTGASPTDIENYVKSLGFPIVNPSNLTVTVNWRELTYDTSVTPPVTSWGTCTTAPCNQPGDAVQVTVSYPFNLGVSIPFIGSFTPTVSSTSQMVISQ